MQKVCNIELIPAEIKTDGMILCKCLKSYEDADGTFYQQGQLHMCFGLHVNLECWQPCFLYITSDDKIQKNDHMMLNGEHHQGRLRTCWDVVTSSFSGKEVDQLMLDDPSDPNRGFGFVYRSEVVKIIATSNTALGLPNLEDEFVNLWMQSYNEGNVIEKGKVQYRDYGCIGYCDSKPVGGFCHETCFPQLVVDIFNKIDIRPQEVLYKKSEVIKLLEAQRELCANQYRSNATSVLKWVERSIRNAKIKL